MQKINIISIKSIFISLLLVAFISGYGQERLNSKSSINRDKPTFKSKQQSIKKLNSRGGVSLSNIQTKNKNKFLNKSEIDTLNFPLAGDYTLYLSNEGGYASGNNSFNDKAKADFFTINQPKKITGILIDFALATGNSDIELAIWDNSGNNGSPGTEIFSTIVLIDQLKDDVQNNNTSFVGFENPVIVNNDFYTGVKLPSASGDTIVVWTNTDGDANPATAWEQWSDNNWVRYDNTETWGRSVSHAIFPIVDTTSNTVTTVIDTLNFPLPGNFAIYVDTVVGGYVCGTNGFNDLAKANYFSNSQSVKVTGILFDFFLATGGNPSLGVRIWDNDGTDNGPGTILGSKNISMDEINNDITIQQLSFIEFDNPISINHSFYAGFMLPTAAGDTLVVWSNEDGDTNPGIAWEKWEDNTWYPFSNTWQLNLAMGIHPIVDYNVGIINNKENGRVNIFPNPTERIIFIETGFLTEDGQIRIYNSAGVLVYESSVNSYDQDYSVDLTGFENGMYIISVTSGQEAFFNKVIKN